MTSGIAPQCFGCSRLRPIALGIGWVCAAYPSGIPKEILVNEVDHTKPYPGDNGLQFQSKKIVRAAGIMFVAPDGSILLTRRSANCSDHQGEWVFPGGGIEDDETPEEAARREALEEIGPHVYTELVPWTRRIKAGVDFITYRSDIPEKFEPVLNEESDAFKWVLPEEVIKTDAGDKKLICLDFDGVVHSYTSGFQGVDQISDPPSPGAIEFIKNALKVCRVAIFSTRSSDPSGIQAMQLWLAEKSGDDTLAGQVEWPTEKPPAHVFIDDRALTFTGEWPSLGEILRFKSIADAVPGKFEEEKHARGGKGTKEGGKFVKKGAGGTPTEKETGEEKVGEQEPVKPPTLEEAAPNYSKALEKRKQENGSGEGTKKNLAPAPEDKSQWPDHIKKLKIPPAWIDVQISSDPDSPLQATGKDVKGRTQYVYSTKYAKSQSAAKFKRIKKLSGKYDSITNQNTKAMKSRDPVVREHAEITVLIMEMGLRPGSERETGAEEKAYGATTLESTHVVTSGGKTSLVFVGKKGVRIDLPVTNEDLAKDLKERAKSGGKLFPNVSDSSLRRYVGKLGGGGFKTKDLRTLKGTSLAQELVDSAPIPTSVSEYKKAVRSIATAVSSKLGNTPTVALQSYISPTVFSQWQQSISQPQQRQLSRAA